MPEQHSPIDEKVLQSFHDRLDPESDAEVRAWRAMSVENEARYQELLEIVRHFTEADVESAPPSVQAVIGRAEASRVLPLSARTRTAPRRWPAILAIAASIVFVLLVGQQILRPLDVMTPSLQAFELTTGADETVMATLPDGTIVHLGPSSQLEASGTRERREVWLDGTAFFGVARSDGEVPFVVKSRYGETTVLGTRFEVVAEEEELRVAVIQGRVVVGSAGEEVEVMTGQMTVAVSNSSPVVSNIQDRGAILDWMGQSLVFHETSLAEAAREIEQVYGLPVEVRGEEVASQTVTGGFKDRSFEEVLSSLCQVIYARCTVDNFGAVIQPRKPL